MPWIKEWENPDIVLEHKGVVVHEHWDDMDDQPVFGEYAIFEPDGYRNDKPFFRDMEYDDPIEIVKITELCALPTLPDYISSPSPDWQIAVLRMAIDQGILTQKGIVDVEKADAFGWAEDTKTMELPI